MRPASFPINGDSSASPRTMALIANAVGWAKQILRYVNNES